VLASLNYKRGKLLLRVCHLACDESVASKVDRIVDQMDHQMDHQMESKTLKSRVGEAASSSQRGNCSSLR